MKKSLLTKFPFLLLLVLLFSTCGETYFLDCLCEKEDFIPFYRGCYEESCEEEVFNCARSKMLEKIYKELKYPQEARENGIEGAVYVEFLVSKEGQLSDFRTFNEPLGYGLEDASIEAVKTLNEEGFYPAYENCEPVEFIYQMPVKFKLAG